MSEEKLSYYIGLDIGTMAARCVVGELSDESPTPRIIGFGSAENSGMRKGNVAHIDEVAQAVINAISEAERMSGREIKTATINVNGAHVEGINSKGVIAISSPDRQISVDDRTRGRSGNNCSTSCKQRDYPSICKKLPVR
jgi:cell division protein FtsA